MGVTDLFYPGSFFPFTGDSYGQALTGRAIVGEQPPGGPAVAVIGRTPRLVGLIERYGADPSVLSHTFGVVLQPRLPARTMPGGREGLQGG